jgi:carbamoyltransferase
MIVLGINDGHDAGATLLADGKVILHSNEERRRNVKNYAGVPTESIAALFSRSGIDPSAVDLVALSSKIRTTFPTRGRKRIYSVLNALSFFARSEWATNAGRWVLSRVRKRKELLDCLAGYGLAAKPLLACDHHETHAATAFFHRPWDGPATVLTMDGAGDGLCASVSVGDGLTLRRLAATPKYHSVAAGLYSGITAHLGLKPFEHEYKVMGMAPYGQAEYCIDAVRRAFSVDGLTFRNHTGRTGTGVGIRDYYHARLREQRFDNVSAACQLAFEEMVVQWVRNAVAATGVRAVAAAGGAFLNVKANKLIRELPEVDKLYVYPASDDGGTPVGAAILGYLELCRRHGQNPTLDLPKSMYQGLSFTDADYEAAGRASGLPFRRMADPADEVGALLASGKIVARFDGAEELGPRALGNRSILADPRDLRFIRKLNFAIKQRDFWMPFAASVLEEDAARYLKDPSPWAFYMIEAFDSTPEGGDVLVAGSHPFDRTIRPQLVNDLNPGYRDTIRSFKKRTGVGGILNTSFNLHGYPIVGTPEIAIDTLRKSELDALQLGPFLVTKSEPLV